MFTGLLQNGVDVQALNNLAIGFRLFLDIDAKLRVSVRVRVTNLPVIFESYITGN